MLAIVKPEKELNKIRVSGSIVAEIHKELKKLIVPGVTTDILEQVTLDITAKHKAKPSFLGYRGFPFATCVSVNEVIVHGFPSAKMMLLEGDVVGVDVGVLKDGYHGDAAFTMIVGESRSKEDELLLAAGKECLTKAIAIVKDGTYLGDIGNIIETTAKQYNFDVVRNYVGHGIGKNLHEYPQINNYGKPKTGLKLKAGMVICIEPMLTIGSSDNHTLSDGWTVVTNTGNNAAHFEHQLIVHKDRAEIVSV